MGTWGSKIYEDDVALDIRHDFLIHLEKSIDIKKIEEIIYQETIDKYSNQDDIDMITLALCCVELETGTLSQNIKNKTLDVIESERNYEYWKKEADAESASLRKRELNLIKKYLLKYDGKPVKRRSWVELQKVDKDYLEQDSFENYILDNADWYVEKVPKNIDSSSLYKYANAHIVAFIYWLASRGYIVQALDYIADNTKNYKKLSGIVNNLDNKLYIDYAKDEYKEFISAYYANKYHTDYAKNILRKHKWYTYIPNVDELEKLANVLDSRLVEYNNKPYVIDKHLMLKSNIKLILLILAIILGVLVFLAGISLYTYTLFNSLDS